ncbi:hypothetical protein AAVH_11676 [Aphelenchoides avenae]|nr:hypothetical protein AAVH_11676 [Aphelenchus avenae]
MLLHIFFGVLFLYLCYEVHLACKKRDLPGVPLLGALFDSINLNIHDEDGTSKGSKKKKKHHKHHHTHHKSHQKKHGRSKSKSTSDTSEQKENPTQPPSVKATGEN